MSSMTYEVTHDGPDGKPVSKQFSDLDKAREYAAGKVFAGGPARFVAVTEAVAKESSHHRAKPEPDPEPKHRPRARVKAKPTKAAKPTTHRRHP